MAVTDVDSVIREIEKTGRKVKVSVKRAMDCQPLVPIQVIMHPNCYELVVGENSYLYFTAETLLAGILYRWCWQEESSKVSLDDILRMVGAAMTWVDHKDLLAELEAQQEVIASLERKLKAMRGGMTKEHWRIKTATSILNGKYREFRTNLSLLGEVEDEDEAAEEDDERPELADDGKFER